MPSCAWRAGKEGIIVKRRSEELQEAVKTSAPEWRTCYICREPIDPRNEQYIGNGMARHQDCDPCAKERAEVHTEEDAQMAKAKRTGKAAKRAQGARVAKTAARTSNPTTSGAARAAAKQGAPEGASGRKPGLVDAAIVVMREAGKPMKCQEVVAAILARNLWTTSGKTPAATLYSSILREIQKKGVEARFVKADRGQFALAG
jgi:hypothetical protein